MNQPPSRPSRRKKFSGNHQRGWLWGFHAVTETLLNGTWPVIDIHVTDAARKRGGALLGDKQLLGIPLHVVDNDRLRQLTGSSEHQGLAARLGEFPYRKLADVWPLLDAQTKPLAVICDRIQDAFNFGAILRCCDGAGAAFVVVGDRHQAEVTPHVVRSSSGGINHIAVTRVGDLIDAASQLRRRGLRLIAADANAPANVWATDLSGPAALVIGSEAHGVDPDLLAICDAKVGIPMRGRVTSLNAAVAAGILMYEIRRQQELQVRRS